MKKRILSLLLCIALCLSVMPAVAYAADSGQGRTQLNTPTNIHWDGTVAVWDAVDGATGYDVDVYMEGSPNGATGVPETRLLDAETSSTSIDCRYQLLNTSFKYYIKVSAMDTTGTKESSEVVNGPQKNGVGYPQVENIRVENGMLTWTKDATYLTYLVSTTVNGSVAQEHVNGPDYDIDGLISRNGGSYGTYTVTVLGRNGDNDATQATEYSYAYQAPFNETGGVNSVTAVTKGVIAPVYGAAVTKPTVTITSGKPAYIESVSWQRKEGTDWVSYTGDTFIEGTYRLAVLLAARDNSVHITEETKLRVDDYPWQAITSTHYAHTPFSWMQYVYGNYEVAAQDGVYHILSDNARVTANKTTAAQGDNVVLTVSPESGFSVATIKAIASDGTMVTLNSDGSNRYTFVMPAATVRITVTFAYSGDAVYIGAIRATGTITAPVVGQPVTNPKLTYTTDSQLPALRETLLLVRWQKYENNAWTLYQENTFSEGTYRLYVVVHTEQPDVRLNDSTTLSLNGSALSDLHDQNYPYYGYTYSPGNNVCTKLYYGDTYTAVKGISRVDLNLPSGYLNSDGLLVSGKSISGMKYSTTTTGVTNISCAWTENGKAVSTGNVKPGAVYNVAVMMQAAAGYSFTEDLVVYCDGVPVAVTDDWADFGASYRTVEYNGLKAACLHERANVSYDRQFHWKVCEDCGTTILEPTAHSYTETSSGNSTIYKCSGCDYSYTASAGKTYIGRGDLAFDYCVVGGRIPAIALTASETDLKIDHFQWYKNDIAEDNRVDVGSTFAAGTYKCVVTASLTHSDITTLHSAFKFWPSASNAFQQESVTLANNETELTATLTVTVLPAGEIKVIFPTIGDGMTYGEFKEALEATVNGEPMTNYGLLVKLVDSDEWATNDNDDITTDDSIAVTLLNLNLPCRVASKNDVTIEMPSNAELGDLIVGNNLDSSTLNIGVSYDLTQAVEPAVTPISLVNVTVAAPAYGAAPSKVATPAGDTYTAGAVNWDPADETFAEDSYTVTVPVTAGEGYGFTDMTAFQINGTAVTPTAVLGTVATLQYTFPKLEKPTYSVIVTNGGSKTISQSSYASQNEVKAGVTVSIRPDHISDDKVFAKWCVDANSAEVTFNTKDIHSQTNSFTMPDGNVYLTAEICKRITDAQVTVVVPVAGQPLSYQVGTSSNFGLNPMDNIYTANGVRWAKGQTSLKVADNSVAECGATYKVQMYLLPNEGYAFDMGATTRQTFSVNGEDPVVYNGTLASNDRVVALHYEFTVEHDYGAWTPISETQHQRVCENDATHKETANHTFSGNTCTDCGYTKSVEPKPCNHSETEVKDAKDATCTENGYTGDTYCKDCGEKIATGSAISAKGHAYGSWTSIGDSKHQRVCANDATHVETANHTFSGNTCTVCGYTKSGSGGSSSGGGSSASATYAITVADSTHGSVSTSAKTASAGDSVKITVKPDKGYTLETITVTDKNGKEVELSATKLGETYTFKMPAGAVTVKASFMDDNTMLNYFVDVTASDYYYDAVLWAAEQGITGGVDAVHFDPNGTCTRAQAVTFLWRAAGCPEVAVGDTFTDVAKGSYYEKAVSWALANGITSGTSATTFSPDADCTRAQIVTFLHRANKVDTLNIKNNPFTDVKDGAYYYNAVLWAAENGITGGTSATTFSPDANCTRAQIVTFLYRYMGK